MVIKVLGAGSVRTADVRREVVRAVPAARPDFLVRATHEGPLALTTLSLGLTLLIAKPVKATVGWLALPIGEPLAIDRYLGWTIFVAFDVPKIAAYLCANGTVKYLSSKTKLKAGTVWSTGITLRSFHLP